MKSGFRYPVAIFVGLVVWGGAAAREVNITPSLAGVEVMHKGEPVTIIRNQDTANTVDPEFAKTSRPCPPFCIQPMKLAPGVETVAELEVLDYLEKMGWGEAVLVIDSRTPNWTAKGTIPGSINVPWNKLNEETGGNILEIRELLTRFGVREQDELFDFSTAKTLVLFCNGPWCGQSPDSIAILLRLGYPAHKLKWYRGGMQMWKIMGLTVTE